jgi:glycogen debranching enzyme
VTSPVARAEHDLLQDWLPIGEEPQAAGSITHCKIQRSDGVSSVSLQSGDIDAAREPVTGIYCRDTRYISRLTFSLGGVIPTLLDTRQEPFALSAIFTNPHLLLADSSELPAQSLVLRRRRVLDGEPCETLSISNYRRTAVTVDLRIQIDADFRDIFEVRGFERTSRPPLVNAVVGADEIHYSCVGADHKRRAVQVRFAQRPDQIRDREVVYRIALKPRATHEISISFAIEDAQVARGEGGHIRRRMDAPAWLEGGARMVTDNASLNAALDGALLDILALQTWADGDQFTAAGVPWFDTLFGRDSLITGIQLAAIRPDVLRAALRVLARYQATDYERARDAEPGKIPHELRWGELAQAGEVPFGRYYGSVDATPLFLIAAEEYLRWTDDVAFIRELWPALTGAATWCRRKRSESPGRFLTYSRLSIGGLEQQGWKDSCDGIPWPNGEPTTPPIALVEVQGYAVAGLRAFAALSDAIAPTEAAAIRQESAELRDRLEAAFADPALGYVLCLDGRGRPVPTLASNAGHLLWVGAASYPGAKTVVHQLMTPEMFTGWGIRTLATSMASYNPLGYHTGSVWPHDTSLILAGFRRYGFDAEAERLGTATVEAAIAMPDRQIPELFSGDSRQLRLVPTPYPVSSRPQAWAAASLPYTLITMLGIRPLTGAGIVLCSPLLPAGVDSVQIRNLASGGGSVDLSFNRRNGRVAVEVDNVRGDLAIVLQNRHPDAPPA